MSLESFKRTSLTWNRANDTLNKTPIEIIAGDANARTLELSISNDGVADTLSGYDVRLYWSYADASSAGTATFIADKLNQGIYTLTFPTEMTAPGTILANISLENKDEESVIVSKQITFNVLTSQLNETAVEVTNRIDEFKQLLLTIYPNSVATELSAQKAQIDANASNILLKANDSDLTNLKNQIDQISSELTSFGITPKQINTIQSLLTAIENDATDADVAAVITSLNTIKSQVDAMANGSYTAKANKTDLDSLTQTVNNQGASIATKRDINAVDSIAQGGTNASTRPLAFNNLAFMGSNPITTPSDDTPANWSALGSGYAWYTQNNALNNQPGQWGHLIQYNQPGTKEILQIFSVAPSDGMYYRRSNNTGWRGRTDDSGIWTKLLDSSGLGIDYAKPHPVGSVISNTSSSSSGYTVGNWSLIGSTTVYPNFNLLRNTRNLSATSTSTSWNTLFSSSQIYDSGIKSLSGVSALTFSFDVYIPLNATVGDVIPIQLKGQNSQATNVGVDDFNTIIGWVAYVIKQSDLGKTIHASSSIQKGPKYQSFDTALADTSSITIRQSTNISGLVYSKIKLEQGSTDTPWMLSQQEVATIGYPTDVESTTLYYWKRTG